MIGEVYLSLRKRERDRQAGPAIIERGGRTEEENIARDGGDGEW